MNDKSKSDNNLTLRHRTDTFTNTKKGFCLTSVERLANAEWSPTWTDTWTCLNQGIEPGWADTYQSGIPCQLIDITDVPSPTWATVGSLDNPDALMCEGSYVLTSNGSLIWEATKFLTYQNTTVEVEKCKFLSGYAANNLESINIDIPEAGISYVNRECPPESHPIGPLRNCEFYQSYPDQPPCQPNTNVTLTCSLASSNLPYQVLRVCPYSIALDLGISCRHQDSIANVIISPLEETTVSFICPGPLDDTEIGGYYSLMSAELVGSHPVPIHCH